MYMAKIIAPNKSYTGISASVAFTNGIGETEDKSLIEWFHSHGYKIEKEDKNPISLEDMKKEDLVKLATELEIDFTSKNTKDELIELIKSKQEEHKND